MPVVPMLVKKGKMQTVKQAADDRNAAMKNGTDCRPVR